MDIASDKVIYLFKQLPFFKDEELVIYPIEDIEEPIFKLLDRKCGIDYFITNKDGTKAISFAWRAGNTTPERCRKYGVYNAFSLRQKRNKDSSKEENCEIAKRMYSIDHGLIYPLYTVEACFIDETLISLGMAKTTDVYHAFGHCPKRNCDPFGKNKEVFFYGLSWQIMMEHGYRVYTWYFNDKCKRTYRINDYRIA